jgi:hypothetical protein
MMAMLLFQLKKTFRADIPQELLLPCFIFFQISSLEKLIFIPLRAKRAGR